MKKCLLWSIIILGMPINISVAATDLITAFQQAVIHDPIYQQAIAQRFATQEEIPIHLAGFLPHASLTASTPNVTRTLSSGSASGDLRGTAQGYNVTLNLSQTVFDFEKFAGMMGAQALAKSADATLSAATQNLMLRVAQAYFTILQDQDSLSYIQSSRAAYAKQLNQTRQQYNAGLKTITDVYTARAPYETAIANCIAAETLLANDKENLRAITGTLYTTFDHLAENFPLVAPQPTQLNAWITAAGKQNWSIKAAQYQAQSEQQKIKQQFAAHLPTVSLQGSYQDNYSATSGKNIFEARGLSQTHISSASITFNIPLSEGGKVMAETEQAKYNYQISLQQLALQLHNTLTQTRQSYLNVIAGINKIAADKQAVQANLRALAGMQASYQVGKETLINILNQQQNIFQAQRQYATDRYSYINYLLNLKCAAGTLGVPDLVAINSWLIK